jgi:hypothetical protein
VSKGASYTFGFALSTLTCFFPALRDRSKELIRKHEGGPDAEKVALSCVGNKGTASHPHEAESHSSPSPSSSFRFLFSFFLILCLSGHKQRRFASPFVAWHRQIAKVQKAQLKRKSAEPTTQARDHERKRRHVK